MASPTVQKLYAVTPNQRLTFTSLNQLVGDFAFAAFGVGGVLPLAGIQCKGSSNGTVGAMDGVNRLVNAAAAMTRFNGSGGAQSWIVFTLASGADVLWSYDGNADDVFLWAFSPGGNYVAAGTPNQKPVASDEDVIATGQSMVGTTTSADRVWDAWVDSTKKLIRFAIFRQGGFLSAFGVELFTPTVVTPTVIANPTWGFFYGANGGSAATMSGNYSTNAGGKTQAVVSSVAKSINLGASLEVLCGNVSLLIDHKPEPQGANGYAFFPLGLASNSDSSAVGKYGNRIDWWLVPRTSTDGDTLDSKRFITLNGDMVWPWDGTTAPVTT